MNCDSIFHNLVIKQPSALPSNMSNIGQYWAILGDIRRYWAILGDIGAQSRPIMNMRNETCVETQTSKVPTRVAFLLISILWLN